ncbi:RNA 3'-terminal phosphate cyclase [Xylariaceae sp. FL0594]|nr:RNA 3'-terminal phosphate cyclase [Xylariaceae sp. FL0594]
MKKPLLLDGCAGEGGGQLVRLACALAAVTSQPIRIINVRGNRERSPGLKPQHASAIEWLAKVTGAEVEGLHVGSRTLEFRPSVPATALRERKIQIVAGSKGASTLLIFQAVFPYLLYAGNDNKEIELEIQGSTNASFSPSFEYVDQVLLPTLEERFEIVVGRQLVKRAWTVGPLGDGCVRFRFKPLAPGHTLRLVKPWLQQPLNGINLERIDISILVPHAVREPLERGLVARLGAEFPDVDINFVLNEESGHDARLYVLLVAHAKSSHRLTKDDEGGNLRWGRDYLYDRSAKKKKPESLAREMAATVTKRLYEEIRTPNSGGGSTVTAVAAVDEYLQDQLVVFQALAQGRSTYWCREADRWKSDRSPSSTDISTPGGIDDEITPSREEFTSRSPDENENENSRIMRRDKVDQPFGFGSLHTTTARWVASELMPAVQWFNNGTICEGAGVSVPGSEAEEAGRQLSGLSLS